MLVALTKGFMLAVRAVARQIGTHIIEGQLIVPLLQRRRAHIAPALILIRTKINQLLFGPMGIVFAAPIAVVTYTAVNLLYVRNVLEEKVDLREDVPV